MKYLAFLLVFLAFIKTIYYGIFEIKEKNNKSSGILVFIVAVIGLILPYTVLFIWY